MDYTKITDKIIELRNADLALREKILKNGQLFQGYNEEMKELHNKNAHVLNDIIDSIGYPTIDKVGKEANEAAWMIIQHSIGQPAFMKECKKLLEIAVSKNLQDTINLAYLTDRIAVLQGKPQLYGTQFDWDKNGNLVPNHFDDLDKVNKRRKSIGLNSLEEQTKVMQDRVKDEGQTPPLDFEKRQQELEAWKKQVGWI